MDENLKNLNATVANYEKISQIQLYPTEFEKTPKRSIKRYLYNSIAVNQVCFKTCCETNRKYTSKKKYKKSWLFENNVF